jgi:hypothetical protein
MLGSGSGLKADTLKPRQPTRSRNGPITPHGTQMGHGPSQKKAYLFPLSKLHADDRLSRRWQVDAGGAAALDPAAAVGVCLHVSRHMPLLSR